MFGKEVNFNEISDSITFFNNIKNGKTALVRRQSRIEGSMKKFKKRKQKIGRTKRKNW